MKNKVSRLWNFAKEHMAFFRILAFYLAGCTIVLTIFSSVLTWYLTKHAAEVSKENSADMVTQVYSTTNYVLNDAYDSFYHLYQSNEVDTAIFAKKDSVEEQLTVSKIFRDDSYQNGCVDSIYILNRSLNKVYSSKGYVSTFKDFYDKQALTLFNFYNENSSTIFLPRTTTMAENGQTKKYNFVTLIFARKDAQSNVAGGMIVNIDQNKLHSLITGDTNHPENIYIVSNSGSIISNTDPSKINTTLQGTELYNKMTAAASANQVFSATYDGKECMVTCRRADKLLFYFLCIVPMQNIDSDVLYIRNFILSVFVALLCLACAIAMLFSRKIYHPLSKLVDNLRNRAQQSDAAGNPEMDEYGFLNSAYKSLSSEIESLSSEKQSLVKVKARDVLTQLLRGEYTSEELCLSQLEECRISFSHSDYTVAMIAFDDYANLRDTHPMEDITLYKYAILNVLKELLSGYCTVLDTENDLEYITLILNFDHRGNEADLLRNAFQQTETTMRKNLNFSVTTGVGRVGCGLLSLPGSYADAQTAVDYRMVVGQSAVIFYDEISSRQNLMPDYPEEMENELILAIKNRSIEKAGKILDAFFSRISLANVDYINMSLSQLLIRLNRVMKSLSVNDEIKTKYNYHTFSTQMKACDCLESKKGLLLQFCNDAIQSRSNEVQNKKNAMIDKICKFIQTNYSDSMLDLNSIANYAELSVSYLRTVFREITGKAPNEYITDFRIGQAKKLLETTSHSTKDIASAVGYSNHRYFYRVFKERTGRTATEYRLLADRSDARNQEESR